MFELSKNIQLAPFIVAGLRFEKVINADVWHSDVELYSVFDLNSTELIGYFYLDMYSRFICLLLYLSLISRILA